MTDAHLQQAWPQSVKSVVLLLPLRRNDPHRKGGGNVEARDHDLPERAMTLPLGKTVQSGLDVSQPKSDVD